MEAKKGYFLTRPLLALIIVCSFGFGVLCHYLISNQHSDYITGDKLSEREYTDGLIIFECPQGFNCETSGGGDFPVMHVITSDTSDFDSYTEATIESDWNDEKQGMNHEAFLNLWNTYHAKDSNKNGFTILDDKKEEKDGKNIYEKDSYYIFKADTLTSRFVLIHDTKSQKICLIDWISTEQDDKNIQILQKLTQSVRFKE